MRQSQLTPPPFTREIGLSDQIYFFYTGEMSPQGAKSTLERAKERLEAFKDTYQKRYQVRIDFYREKISNEKAFAKLEKSILDDAKSTIKSIQRLEKFISDATKHIN